MLSKILRAQCGRRAVIGRRWCGEKAPPAKEEMTDEELDRASRKLTWWPYLLVGGFLTFVWIPEYTKFVWHLRLQAWVHEIYWKVVLPKEEAASVIRESRIGIPSAQRTSQNPLAACPLKENNSEQSPEELLRTNELPPGHPNPFAAGIIQVTEDLKAAPGNNRER